MISPDLLAFLDSGLSIHLGTRTAALEPIGARVVAARPSDDRTHVTLFISKAVAPRVLPNLEANRQAAICFTRPSDDRACQVKGEFVSARPATLKDKAFIDRQWEKFLEDLEVIGYPRVLLTGWHTWPCVAVTVRATAVFDQTPGPGAGAAIA